MEVTHNDDQVTHAVIGGGTKTDFKIEDNGFFMHMLSASLYKDQRMAVAREVLCNADDAHKENNVTVPFDVTLTAEKLTIRDYGPGIPDDLIGQVYGTYGGSTKRNSTKATGGFGLGCKSPFAYTDNFQVTSFCNGVKTIYRMSKSDSEVGGKPSIIKILSVPTTETGLEVNINIAERRDVDSFAERIKIVLANGEMNANFNGTRAKVLPFSLMENGYHIIDLIADEDYRKLSRNNAMTDNMAAKIQLGKALAGDHVGILERVKITEGYGGGIQITGMVKKSEAKKAVNVQKTGTKKRVAKAIESKAPVTKPRVAAVDAKAIAKQVTAQKATGGSARQLKARELFELFENATRAVKCNARDVWEAAMNLVTFKKTAKVSWDKLGITLFEAERLENATKTEPAFEEEVNEEPIPAPVAKPVKKAMKPVKPVKAEPAKTSAAATDRQAKMRGLYSKGTKAAAVEALTIKKASKKSWEALGLTKAEGETISKLAGK